MTTTDTAGIDWSHASFPSDRDHDAYRNKSLSLNLSHEFSDQLEVGFNLLDSRGKSEYDNSFGRYDFASGQSVGQKPYTDYTVSSASAYIDAQPNEAWQTRVELGHSENRDTKRDKLSADFSVFNTYRDSINWQNDLTLDQQNSLILGGEWYEDRFHGSTTFSENSRWNRAAFIQHRFKGEWFSTELGLRRDDNQQFGGQNSWSGTLTLPVNSDNDVLLSYSEGFRAPSFNDLYYPGGSNPNLKPEHSKSYELQWRSQLTDTTRLETSLYRTDLKDAIIAQQQNNYIPYNVANARINGFEAALKQEFFGWQGNLGLSIIDPRDRSSGHTLARRARRTLNLDLDRQFEQLSLGASWQAISSSYDAEDNKNRLAGYYLLGLRSSWALNREVALSLKVDNLLDRRYTRAWYSYDEPNFANNQPYREEGRTWMLGVTWTPQL
ncbi:TonB-dependent receptor [Pseudomonas gessardii]